MLAWLLTLGLLSSLPPLSSRGPFPSEYIAETQQEHCREHLERLRLMEGISGYQDGRWQRYQQETLFMLHYWELLYGCHNAPGERWKREKLAELQRHIGPDRFKAGWSPAEIPEKQKFSLFGEPVVEADPTGVINP